MICCVLSYLIDMRFDQSVIVFVYSSAFISGIISDIIIIIIITDLLSV